MKDQFVGRRTEIYHVKKLVDRRYGRSFICIAGDGGVGKTTLLREIIAQLGEQHSRMTAKVDFDLPQYRSLAAVRRVVAESLNSPVTEKYLVALDELAEIEGRELSLLVRENAAARVEDYFNQLINELTNGSRHLVIALDTIERIQNTSLLEDLINLFASMSNVVVLLAGRFDQETLDQFSSFDDGDNYLELFLKPFNIKDSLEYLAELLPNGIDEEIRYKLWLLTGGTPILMDLAATWLTEQHTNQEDFWPGKQMLTMSVDSLKSNLSAFQSRFRTEVVDNVRSLKSPMDWAIMYMALMEYPFSATIAQHLLELSYQQAEQLMDKLRDLFFVRADLTLHDEMRELLQNYAWPYMDSQGQMRHTILNQLLEFTRQHRVKKPGWERWYSEAEELHYRLLLDLHDGHNYFKNTFDDDREHSWLFAAQMLIQTMRSNEHWKKLLPVQRLDVRVRQAQLFTFFRQERRMIDECNHILRTEEVTNALKVDAYCAIAYGQRDIDPPSSIRNYNLALSLVDENADPLLRAQVLNWAGQVYRRLGEMEKAIEYFVQALPIFQQFKDWRQLAATENNLAYIYRQLGQVDRAFNLARASYVVRERLNDQLGLAYSYQTIGELYRDENNLTQAEERFLEAREIFESLNREQEVAVILVALANLARKRHEPALAEKYLVESLALFEKWQNEEGRAQALNEFGCELRKRAYESFRMNDMETAEKQFQQSKEYFAESIAISKRMSNMYRLADNLADMALLYRYWYETTKTKHAHESTNKVEPIQGNECDICKDLRFKSEDAAHQAIYISRRYKFPLHENRAIETLGDLAYAQGKFFKAFAQFYIQACLDMARYYGSSLRRYRVIFDRVHKRMLSLDVSDELIRYTAAYMSRRWQEEGMEKSAPGFINVYETIVNTWFMGEVG